MKTLVVYDSVYGNTEKIARAIAAVLAPAGEAKVVRPGELEATALEPVDLLIVGSPTHGGRPVKAVQEFLRKIPANALENASVAAFDTGISSKGKGLGIRILTGVLGYAAGRIAKSLQGKGGHLAMPPEGFIVEDKEGPLRTGEIERATGWAKSILESQP